MISSENDTQNSSDERRRGKDKEPKEIILVSWGDRFLAWLIDFIIVSIALAILFAAISIPIWFFYYDNNISRVYQNVETFHYIISSLTFFGYWIYFESTSGQSIGKRVLKIKITDLYGNRVNTKSAAIEKLW